MSSPNAKKRKQLMIELENTKCKCLVRSATFHPKIGDMLMSRNISKKYHKFQWNIGVSSINQRNNDKSQKIKAMRFAPHIISIPSNKQYFIENRWYFEMFSTLVMLAFGVSPFSSTWSDNLIVLDLSH